MLSIFFSQPPKPTKIFVNLILTMATTPESKEDLLFLVNLCENAKRYDDMIDAMKKLIQIGQHLSTNDRNLLSKAYLGALSYHQKSLHALCEFRHGKGANMTDEQLQTFNIYREQIEKEQIDICKEVVDLMDDVLLPLACTAEPKVFYMRMKGDYYRFMSDVKRGKDQSDYIELAKKVYEKAFDIASAELNPSNATRLNLAHHLYMFYLENAQSPDDARKLAGKALDDAKEEIRRTNELPHDAIPGLCELQEDLDFWKKVGEDELVPTCPIL